MPNCDDTIGLASSTLVMPLISVAGSTKVKSEAVSKTPSHSSTPGPKSGSLLKHTLQDAFAEGSAKENQTLEHLGTQKHECAIGELELKHCKLENKVMEKQHQQEHHKYCMMQMWMMMSQNNQMVLGMMQHQNQLSLGGLGLMDELNDILLPSESSLFKLFLI